MTRRHLLLLVLAGAVAAAAVPGAALAAWGGRVTAATGEAVTVRASDAYPQDAALLQQWADFLTRLVHGPEIGTVTLYLAPLAEVQGTCGRGAYACYSSRGSLIVASAYDPAPDVTATAVITHEYGHHVASSRTNAPWDAVEFGTKRWASYENVCSRARAGVLFPGAEAGDRYTLNPGEAFAEAYRVLNERRSSVAETSWDIVTDLLYPDAGALTALQQDIVSPWTGNSRVSYSSSVGGRARTRAFAVATPFDGTLRATVTAARRPVTLTVVAASGTRVARTTAPAGRSRSVSATVCGTRAYRIQVATTGAVTPFSLSVLRP